MRGDGKSEEVLAYESIGSNPPLNQSKDSYWIRAVGGAKRSGVDGLDSAEVLSTRITWHIVLVFYE